MRGKKIAGKSRRVRGPDPAGHEIFRIFLGNHLCIVILLSGGCLISGRGSFGIWVGGGSFVDGLPAGRLPALPLRRRPWWAELYQNT